MSIFGIPIILAVAAFFLVVFVHELGHYIIGRLCGIGAEVFSIGMGPKVCGYVDRRNTEWRICILPIGGYVRFLDENNYTNSNESRDQKSRISGNSFSNSSLVSRSLTVSGGPIANFILAITIFSISSLYVGIVSDEPIIDNVAKIPTITDEFMSGDRVLKIENETVNSFNDVLIAFTKLEKKDGIKVLVERNGKSLQLITANIFQPIVLNVEMFSPAYNSGLEVGDVIIEANEKKINNFNDLKEVISKSLDSPVKIKIWRKNVFFDTFITPELIPTETKTGDMVESTRIGIRGGTIISPLTKMPSLHEAIYIGFKTTYGIINMSIIGLMRIIDSTISPKHITGPIGIATALSQSAKEGFLPFIFLVGAISAGLGIVNLFPIPILDGGHLIFYLYEAIVGEPPSKNFLKYFMALGLIILVSLMLFATFNDIERF